jgi:hypothetical protein
MPSRKTMMAWQESAPFRHDVPALERKDAVGKTVCYRIDLENLPPMTEVQQAKVDPNGRHGGQGIDHSDIPRLDGSCWQQAMLWTLQNKDQERK